MAIIEKMRTKYYKQIVAEVRIMFPEYHFDKSKDIIFKKEERKMQINIIEGNNNILLELEPDDNNKIIFNNLIIDWEE